MKIKVMDLWMQIEGTQLIFVMNFSVYFFSMKIKMMDLWMQIEGTKLIFVMNISVLYFFKFASIMPQIAQILVSTFKIFRGADILRKVNTSKYKAVFWSVLLVVVLDAVGRRK